MKTTTTYEEVIEIVKEFLKDEWVLVELSCTGVYNGPLAIRRLLDVLELQQQAAWNSQLNAQP